MVCLGGLEGFMRRGLGSKVSPASLLGGSWDLVSRVISTLSGVKSNYNCSYLN